MKIIHSFFVIIFIIILFSFKVSSKERWKLDKNLSKIFFELPVLFANNVEGSFKEINGVIEIDLNTKKNNRAVFSVNINSVEMNYKKYKPLLLSEIFFEADKYKMAIVDTKKFSYENESVINLHVELQMKDVIAKVPIEIEVIRLAENLVEIKAEIIFSRKAFKIGKGKWSSTAILKDQGKIKADLFLFKE